MQDFKGLLQFHTPLKPFSPENSSKSNSVATLNQIGTTSRFSVFPTTKSLRKPVNATKNKKPILVKNSKFRNSHDSIVKFPHKNSFWHHREAALGNDSQLPLKELKPELQRPINLLHHILFIIKAAKILRFRSLFRPFKFLTETQMAYINDRAFFPEMREKMQGFLRRFTEKNVFKKAYFLMMSFLMRYLRLFGILTKYLHAISASFPVIKPYQKGKVLWDILILVTIVFYFFVIPLQIGFDFYYDEQVLDIFHSAELSEILSEMIILVPEFLLIIDTILKFFTGFYENGVVITDRVEIIRHYLKKGLFFDILSYCPILAQPFLKKSSFGGFFLKFVQLLMFCKLKRVKLIMSNFQEIISLKGKHDHILQLLILAYRIVLFSHVIACLWHAVGYYNENGDAWLDALNLRKESWNLRYWRTLYWAVSVMVTISNGQILPQNPVEYGVGVLVFLVSALFFGYSLNTMRGIFENMERNEKIYKENVGVMSSLMQRNHVEFELQGRVRKYLEYISHQDSDPEKEAEVLDKLTNTLRKEVVLAANANHLFNLPFFQRNFSAETLEELSYCLKKVRFSPEEYIYKKNQTDEYSLFLILSGTLETFPEVQKRHPFGLSDSGIIGHRSFLTEEPRENSIRSCNFSTLLELKRSDFMSVLKAHPEDLQRFFMIRDQLKFYGVDPARKKGTCECCDKDSHGYLNCPFVHFIPDRDFLVKKSAFSQPQKRNRIGPHLPRHKLKSLMVLQRIQEQAHMFNDSMSAIQSDFENEDDGGKALEFEVKTPKNMTHGDNEINKGFGSFIEELAETTKIDEKNIENDIEDLKNNSESNNNQIIAANILSNTKYESNKNLGDENIEKLRIHRKFPSSNLLLSQEMNYSSPRNDSQNRFSKLLRKELTIEEKIGKLKRNDTKELKRDTKGESSLLSMNKVENKQEMIKSSVNIEKKSEKNYTFELFMLDFEEAKDYVNYFPEGNFGKVVENLKKKYFGRNSTIHHGSGSAKYRRYTKMSVKTLINLNDNGSGSGGENTFFIKPIPVKIAEIKD